MLGILFDQNLEKMEQNYSLAKTKVQAIANSWKNRYVSVYGKVCVIKTLMLPKLTHIATVLPNLSTKQIKEIEQVWYNYLTPKKGAARADKKTIHAPTAQGGLGLHYLKEFWQALKVSWIKRMAVSRSFWVNILASQACIEIHTLREIDYLTQGNINKCKNTKNPFWQETFRTFITVQNNLLEEFPEHRLLQLINGNNQVTHDGRARQITSMCKMTLAQTVNPDFTIMSTTQYMANHNEIMWLKKPKSVLILTNLRIISLNTWIDLLYTNLF